MAKPVHEVEASDSRFEFVEGLPTHNNLPSGTTHTVMVIDDLMEEVSNSKTAMDIFTKHSHHRNMTVLFLVPKSYGRTHNKRVISQFSEFISIRSKQDKVRSGL